MDKGIILFDIDRTLLDTDKMSRDRNEAVMKALQVNESGKIDKAKEEYRKTLVNEREYDPAGYAKTLGKIFGEKSVELILDIYYGSKYGKIYRNAVFPEVHKVLAKLKGNFRLGIFSEGTAKFQNHKFNSLDLKDFFDKELIFILDAKDDLEIINKIPRNAIVVDDKEKICEFLTKNKVRAIWLNKTDARNSDRFETIHSLLELPGKLM